ncbi:tail fiber assembly protein [Brenneria populi]|uniref:Tail fiber assembly protein n=1 Tax=Brenneria populi TaxID=1505588 RepID=A0ABU6JNU6_9GAMM|nr:tail fiber assembly protein [Brenneria populi Li et al. 2015]
MNNYSTEIKTAELNENGLSKNAGWVTVYHVHPATREYLSASYEYLMAGVGLPADSYIDAPELPAAGQALCRSADGKSWEHVPDYRGQIVYDTETRQALTVTHIGKLSEGTTLLTPATEFDKWDGSQWITDTDAQQQALIQVAQQELSTRHTVANDRIQALNDAVELGIATEEETATLNEWKTYRVLLNRVDLATAPEIVWPEAPQ